MQLMLWYLGWKRWSGYRWKFKRNDTSSFNRDSKCLFLELKNCCRFLFELIYAYSNSWHKKYFADLENFGKKINDFVCKNLGHFPDWRILILARFLVHILLFVVYIVRSWLRITVNLTSSLTLNSSNEHIFGHISSQIHFFSYNLEKVEQHMNDLFLVATLFGSKLFFCCWWLHWLTSADVYILGLA